MPIVMPFIIIWEIGIDTGFLFFTGFLENDSVGFLSLSYSHHVVGYWLLSAYRYC